eukprot:15479046-Alexandrium_andersonii.AAC.1
MSCTCVWDPDGRVRVCVWACHIGFTIGYLRPCRPRLRARACVLWGACAGVRCVDVACGVAGMSRTSGV